jgi:dTDP-4-dehydrorhamnose reductase
MRILITGATGMLGQDVRSAAESAGHEATALARAELDICDPRAVEAAVRSTGAETVINCAAWTDVDGAEAEYGAALAINGGGAANVAGAAAAAEAWTIHISTDYVFAGTEDHPYVESDPTGPTSGYGRSKLEGEAAVAAAAPERHTIVRSSWLFGRAGHSFPKTILKLAAERDQLRVVADQTGCPTYTGHLAPALVKLAAAESRLTGIVHLAGDGECSWFEFAREIVAAGGADCQVVPCTTAEFPRPAPRPAYSVLRSERGPAVPILPHWRHGLAAFLQGAEVPA